MGFAKRLFRQSGTAGWQAELARGITQAFGRPVELFNEAAAERVMVDGTEHREGPELDVAPAPDDGETVEGGGEESEYHVFPATAIQRQLWFLDRLEPSGALYNMPFVYRVSGPLDLAALDRSLNTIAARHAILRTTFDVTNGDLEQFVRPETSVPLPVTDLSSQPESDVWELVRQECARPFDLSTGPLLRARVFRTAPDEHILALTTHHMILDGWAGQVLARELRVLYEAFRAGHTAPLPELPMQYGDYAVWQEERLQTEHLKRQLEYWHEHLAGVRAVDLPLDRPRPKLQTYSKATTPLHIPPAVVAGLRDIAGQERATLFMTLLAGFYALLYRYSAQDDIAIGLTVAGRNHSDLERLLGCFSNTLVLRVGLPADLTFRELLLRVHNTAAAAYDHQEVPFELVGEELGEREPGRHALFRILCNQVPAEREEQFGAATILRLPVDLGRSRFDLTFTVQDDDSGDGLAGFVEYNTDLFDRQTIDRLVGHYLTLLEGIVAEPGAAVSRLPLLTDADLRQLDEWNATEVEYDLSRPLHQWIAEQSARTPTAEAVRFRGESLSYAELEQRANQLAQELVALGVGPETLVGVCMDRSLELVVSLVAVLKAGGAYVPLDPEWPRARLQAMLEDAMPAALLVQDRLKHALPETDLPVLAVDTEWPRIAAQRSAEPPPVAVDPGNAAYAIFTSGSTGRPKAVVNEHRGIVNRLVWMQQEFRLTVGDRVLQKTPYSFDVSVWEFFWPLMYGATLVVAEPGGHRDPAYLVDTIVGEGITSIHFVPSMLSAFLTAAVERCVSLRLIVCSGEALAAGVADETMARLPEAGLFNLYGPTEAAVEVTWWRCEPGSAGAGVPIGRPVANTQIHILDRHGQRTPIGVRGELYIGGVQVARGYLGQPDLTAEKFVPDPFAGGGARMYRTGDLACWRPDGAVEFLGRMDFQVKVRGVRIELGEIEARLRELNEVADCVVTAWAAGSADQRLAAYVVFEAGQGLDVTELRRRLGENLPDYMIPAVVVPLAALPLTPTGKVDRKALPDPLESVTLAEREYEPPQGAAEQAIAGVWQELLGVERVGRHDNFFELGGHSLLAMRAVGLLQRDHELTVPPRELFFRTVAQLAPSEQTEAPAAVPTSAGSKLGGEVASTEPDGEPRRGRLGKSLSRLFGGK